MIFTADIHAVAYLLHLKLFNLLFCSSELLFKLCFFLTQCSLHLHRQRSWTIMDQQTQLDLISVLRVNICILVLRWLHTYISWFSVGINASTTFEMINLIILYWLQQTQALLCLALPWWLPVAVLCLLSSAWQWLPQILIGSVDCWDSIVRQK